MTDEIFNIRNRPNRNIMIYRDDVYIDISYFDNRRDI